jgi:FixJ family two-component response regulator
MPELNGFDVLQALRVRGHNMPVIFVTGDPSSKLRNRAL